MEEKKNEKNWWDNEYWWLTPPTEIRAEEPPEPAAGHSFEEVFENRFIMMVSAPPASEAG